MRYTVTEFRKNIREILDTVDRGANVTIVRYDRAYDLRSVDPAPGKVLEIDTAGRSVPEALADPKTTATTPKKSDQCPHGYAKGFCKKSDCNRKFAK